jgi:mannitol-1-/sugar-/sorbitol-6-phosphatase
MGSPPPRPAIFFYTRPMSSLQVQGVLFDLDGVLIDSTAGVTRVWRDWGIRQGLDPTQTAHAAHGRRAIDTVRHFAPQLDAEAELRDLEHREIGESHDVMVFPGAARLLASLPPLRWAIVTSGTRDLASHRLRVAGLPVPERMITASDIEQGKPHPEPFRRGAALLGLEPSLCIAVEDAPNGIASAVAAGMPVLALATTYAAAELTQATALLPSLAALQAAVVGEWIRLSW